MRVTKNIKEYVTRKVNEIYEPKIKAATKEYYKEEERLENLLEEIKVKAEKEAQELLKNTGFHITYNRDGEIFSIASITNDELWNEARTEATKLREECRNKIDEIIITLELGGNKKDLEKMLNEIV